MDFQGMPAGVGEGKFGEEDLCEKLDMGEGEKRVNSRWSIAELGMRLQGLHLERQRKMLKICN